MCDQVKMPFCGPHAKAELDTALAENHLLANSEVSSREQKKSRGRVDRAWRSYLVTEEGLKYLKEKFAISALPKDRAAAKSQLSYYRMQRKKLLLKQTIADGDSLECKNCGVTLGRQQTVFCGSACVKEFRAKNHVRICKGCGRTPEEVEFGKHPKTIDGLSIVCKGCNRDRVKTSTANYSPEKRAAVSARRKSDPYRSAHLTRKFGIDLNHYNELLVSQDSACAICKDEFTDVNLPQVDHDHATGAVRALLCRTCNMGLGTFNDDPARIEQAISYLKRCSRDDHVLETSNLMKKRPGEINYRLRDMAGILVMSQEGRVRLLESQGFLCACCGDDLSHLNFRKINIDHDHKNLFIRGALCKHCNIGLGQFYEDEARFRAAIAYLEIHTAAA